MDEELEQEETNSGGGAPGWMVTFGDMMSLLLTFFILLLSMATIDVVKYRQVAESFRNQFGTLDKETRQFDKPEEVTLEDIKNEEDALKIVIDKIVEMVQDSQLQKYLKVEVKDGQINVAGKMTEMKEAAKKTELISQLNSIIEAENMKEIVKVVLDPRGVGVRIADKNLFDSGQAKVKPESFKVLYKIGKLIQQKNSKVLVEGHTDDIPIKTSRYPSNWELSSARASSVARFLIKYSKISTDQIQVVGAADTKPIVENKNNENRSKNRRVEFIFTE